MPSLITIAVVLALTYGAVLGAFLTVSFAIRREDRRRTLSGGAPDWTAQSARFITGWQRARWA